MDTETRGGGTFCRSVDHFYETEIQPGDPWRSEMQEKGTTSEASKSPGWRKSEDVLAELYDLEAEAIFAFIGFLVPSPRHSV